MLFVDIKVSLDQIQRRFSLPAAHPPSWNDLAHLIKQRFDLPEQLHRFNVGLVYKDTEGEDLTISSDAELAEIWPTVTDDDERELDALPPLRFTLINIPAIPSTPSIPASTPTLASEKLEGPTLAVALDDQDMEDNTEDAPPRDDERSALQKDVKAFVDVVKQKIIENKEVKEALDKVLAHTKPGKRPEEHEGSAVQALLTEENGNLDGLTSGIVAALLTPALLGPHPHPPPPPPHHNAPFPFPFPPMHGPPHHRRGSGSDRGGKHEHIPPPPPGAFPMMGFMMPPPPPPPPHHRPGSPRHGPPHHGPPGHGPPHHGPPHHGPPHHGPPHHAPHHPPPPHHHPSPPPPHHSWWPGFGPFGRGMPFLPPHLQSMMGFGGGGGFPGFGSGSGSGSKRGHGRHGKKGRRSTLDIASSDDDLSFSEDRPQQAGEGRQGSSSESGSESELDRPRAPRRKAHRPEPHHEHGHRHSPGHESGGRRSHPPPPPPTHDGPPHHHPGHSPPPPPPCPRHGHEGKHGHGPPHLPHGHRGSHSPPPPPHGKHGKHSKRHDR